VQVGQLAHAAELGRKPHQAAFTRYKRRHLQVESLQLLEVQRCRVDPILCVVRQQ
jgi:hypothetical protein